LFQSSAGIDEELERLLAEDPGLVMDDVSDAKSSKHCRPTSNLSLPNVVDTYVGVDVGNDVQRKFCSSAVEMSHNENSFYDFFHPAVARQSVAGPNVVESVQSSYVFNKK
jgi:hypothetical protein